MESCFSLGEKSQKTDNFSRSEKQLSQTHRKTTMKDETTMKNRAGATLVEVLVAIFVMGIGLLALLTMFPIGILTMRQAIIDQRTAHVVQNAIEIAEIKDIRNATFVHPGGVPSPKISTPFRNPHPGVLTDAPPDRPSHPIFVDPFGEQLYNTGAANHTWVGGIPGIKRVGLEWTTPTTLTPPLYVPNLLKWRYDWFSSLDEIVFNKQAEPAIDSVTKRFERNINYSWGYLLRRPMTDDRAVVDLSVVVYHRRPLGLVSSLQTGENAYNASFNTDTRTISLALNFYNEIESLAPGTWILDATVPTITVAGNPSALPAHAVFYKVVGSTLVNKKQLDVEVQTPIQLPNGPFFNEYDSTTKTFAGRVVVTEWVVDVVHVGPGRGTGKS